MMKYSTVKNAVFGETYLNLFFSWCLYILIFFYSWVYQLDIYLVTVFFMFNV